MAVPSEDISINIRDIQHYLYCPHRWGLIAIECSWSENAFITRANLLHRRVHDPDRSYTSRHKQVLTSVQVYYDDPDYNIFGVTDCIELTKSLDGAVVPGRSGTYQLCIVEYKPTKPKGVPYHFDDLMQVFAQKICVDAVFRTACQAEIYYADQKIRQDLPFSELYSDCDVRLKMTLLEMRQFLQNGQVPPIRKAQKCSGCSMKDLCMPKINRKSWLIQEIIEMGRSDQ